MPQLSVIVPVLDDRAALASLLDDLARQQGCALELLVCDGGSTDGLGLWLARRLPTLPFPARHLVTPRGRARQLNAGGRAAEGEWLLFLHADSGLPDDTGLATALAELQRHTGVDGPCGGHFSLAFADWPAGPARHYYESKARSGRPYSIHGDQGMLLPAACWQELGGFDESLPLLEDTCFAERLRGRGRWVLLPVTLTTSARRLLTEGWRQRQLLNAVLVTLGAIGWWDFARRAPAVYLAQASTGPLAVRPLLRLLRKMLRERSRAERRRLWREAGEFVRRQAWQLAFAHESRRRWRRGLPPTGAAGPLTRWVDEVFEPRTRGAVGIWLATTLTRLCLRGFGGILDRHRRRRNL